MSKAHQDRLATPTTTVSGISDSSSGERVVAASLRPDGSIRKERRVRPGYTPVEDIARYRPPAARDSPPPAAAGSLGRGRGRGVPGLGAAVSTALSPAARPAAREGSGSRVSGKDRERPPPGVQTTPRAVMVASWKVPLPKECAGKGKGKETVQAARARADDPRDSRDAAASSQSGDDRQVVQTTAPVAPPAPAIGSAPTPEEAEKRARALRKKLRQAEQLRNQTSRSPAEQAKVDGVAALEAELAALSV